MERARQNPRKISPVTCGAKREDRCDATTSQTGAVKHLRHQGAA